MTQPDWWYPGYFIGLTIFLLLLLIFTFWGLKWGAREVDRMHEDIHHMDETQRAFEAEMRQRFWGDDGK